MAVVKGGIVVDYIGVEAVGDIVAELGLSVFVEGLVEEIEADFRRWSAFDKSARHAAHSRDGVIELMPISDGTDYTFKYVNGHPHNTTAGLLTVTAFGVLADVSTGYPVLLSELTLTTAIRTAAMSALAARHMARAVPPGRDSRSMALIGNGAQAEFQAVAFHHLLGVREVRLFDCDASATAKLVRNLRTLRLPDLRVVECRDVRDAVRGADIVTTVTADKRNAVILTDDTIEPGMHLNAVGGDCPGKTELDPAILSRRDARVVVEYAPQTRIEGEVQQLSADFPVIEFADLVSGRAVARRRDDEVTIFDSVGFALEDFSALRYLHRLYRQRPALHTRLDLVPDLRNPKDLFALLVTNDRPAVVPNVAARVCEEAA